LDEPTNNLDLQNVQILTEAVNVYGGVLIVISHDEVFLEEIGIDRTIALK
jgi:ATPase subunit of ABC transporter with duplicated ATPase domains